MRSQGSSVQGGTCDAESPKRPAANSITRYRGRALRDRRGHVGGTIAVERAAAAIVECDIAIRTVAVCGAAPVADFHDDADDGATELHDAARSCAVAVRRDVAERAAATIGSRTSGRNIAAI